MDYKVILLSLCLFFLTHAQRNNRILHEKILEEENSQNADFEGRRTDCGTVWVCKWNWDLDKGNYEEQCDSRYVCN